MKGKIMKKFLSLALVAVMLLSTLMFTSCDVNSIMEMLGGNFGSETTPAETTPEETTPPTPQRYTITEAEWQEILKSTNYTWEISTSYRESVHLFSENAIKQTAKNGDDTITVYFEYKNGVVYQILDEENNGQWVALKTEIADWNRFSLGKNAEIELLDFFEEFQYNEETKSYICERSGSKFEFYFEDGKLIKGIVTDNSDSNLGWIIENVGTTIVTLPEYTFAEK